jgi:3-hydroxy-9,10-secoandrosta-1,3,5(10)-triene-9,17-dione monooxygenase reductase component
MTFPTVSGSHGVAAPGASARSADRTHAFERDVFGHFATGVTVVTARGPAGPLGFTCQSFVPLSLDPLLISLALSSGSRTWPAVRDVRTFCINVLADDQEHLSAAFARSGTDKFAGVGWTPGAHGAPLIDGACAWITCTLEGEYDGGDHTIAIGRVVALAASEQQAPLLFHRGRYASLNRGPAAA